MFVIASEGVLYAPPHVSSFELRLHDCQKQGQFIRNHTSSHLQSYIL